MLISLEPTPATAFSLRFGANTRPFIHSEVTRNTSHNFFMLLSGFLHIFNNGKSPETTTKVNIGISNMGYLEYPGYVEVGRRSRPFSLYIWFKKLLISRIRLSRIPRLCRSMFTVPITNFTWVISKWSQFSGLLIAPRMSCPRYSRPRQFTPFLKTDSLLTPRLASAAIDDTVIVITAWVYTPVIDKTNKFTAPKSKHP